MTYLPRLNVPGGTYYAVQRGTALTPIFSSAADYTLFESLLAERVRRNSVRLYAYCLTPDAIHLALQIGEISVTKFMQRLTADYSFAVNQRPGDFEFSFRHRYKAILLDADIYLLRLVHYIHYVPVDTGIVKCLDDYRPSSHPAYLSISQAPWLTIGLPLRQLSPRPEERRQAYAALMDRPPTPEDMELFVHGSRSDPRMVGDIEGVAQVQSKFSSIHGTMTLEQIIQRVVQTLGVERERVFSRSRRRDLSMARALIAWHAIETRVATLSKIARELNRSPSTMCIGIERYRSARPDLFKRGAFAGIAPPTISRTLPIANMQRVETLDEAEDASEASLRR